MVKALEMIRVRTKAGCITNNVKDEKKASSWRSSDVERVMGLFHHVIESSKVGLRKPDPRIYAMMVEALGVEPKACVYLDDLGINLKPAREMGMTTIKVISGEQALADLEAATGFTLR
jgi:putative hydrolase of the HAD superfamily